MAQVIIRKQLEDFLKQEGILELFIENSKKHCSSISRLPVWEVKSIRVAFAWNTTKEGWDYWNDVNNKWGDYQLSNGIE